MLGQGLPKPNRASSRRLALAARLAALALLQQMHDRPTIGRYVLRERRCGAILSRRQIGFIIYDDRLNRANRAPGNSPPPQCKGEDPRPTGGCDDTLGTPNHCFFVVNRLD